MKIVPLLALVFLGTVPPVFAAPSDDPLLDAKIEVVVLSQSYRNAHPRMAEAKARVEALSKSTPTVSATDYVVHVRERLSEAQAEDAALSTKYTARQFKRQVLAEKVKFLQQEIQRLEHAPA